MSVSRTDGWEACAELIPQGQLHVGQDEAQGIERDQACQRHRAYCGVCLVCEARRRRDSARAKYARPAKRYASDLTDGEFALVESQLPPPNRLGRPRTTDLRAVLDAIFYLLRTGCPSGAAFAAPVPAGTDDRRCRSWAMLPKGFPPKSTVFGYFRRWWQDGTLLGLYYGLLVLARQAAGRDPQPTAGIVDSQSIKTTESGGPRGYDAGKKINGRKRHVLVDTLGLLLRALVHPASVQDRDGIAPLLIRIRRRFPWLALLFADGAYQGEVAASAALSIGTGTGPRIGVQ